MEFHVIELPKLPPELIIFTLLLANFNTFFSAAFFSFKHHLIMISNSLFPSFDKSNLPPITRVALYIRVSGEEQKIKGLSLEAQQERLEEYAREKGWIITGIYIDAAKTARKNMHKRAEFQRMIVL